MAVNRPKGSIILEILILLAALLLIAVILLPNKIWTEEDNIAKKSQANISTIYEAEKFYYRTNETYTDSLSKLLTFVQNDSGLQQRQTVVALTRSFLQVIDNILEIPSIKQISNISEAAFEITGDLLGNDRYFRRFENISALSHEISHEMSQFDSSATFPNFCHLKIFVDSLRDIRNKISDFSLQNSILHTLSYTDSILVYYPSYEKDELRNFWDNENDKISDLINLILQTDITKVSSVHDRLKKFIDRLSSSLSTLLDSNTSEEINVLTDERTNLAALQEQFLSPEYFITTKRYGLTALNEVDSMLINFSESNFYCPDSKKSYVISYSGSNLIVESPNLLDEIQKEFQNAIAPVKILPFASLIDQIDTTIAQTKQVMEDNRPYIRRNTDILLAQKTTQAEMENLPNVFFYKYAKEYINFVNTLDSEKKLSVLKPMIEDVLNPMDTLATRIRTNKIADLEKELQSYSREIKKIDSLIEVSRLSASVKRNIKSLSETFQPALDILDQIKSSFNPSFADALSGARRELETSLLSALEGKKEPQYVIFSKRHMNHGSIDNGEPSWK